MLSSSRSRDKVESAGPLLLGSVKDVGLRAYAGYRGGQ